MSATSAAMTSGGCASSSAAIRAVPACRAATRPCALRCCQLARTICVVHWANPAARSEFGALPRGGEATARFRGIRRHLGTASRHRVEHQSPGDVLSGLGPEAERDAPAGASTRCASRRASTGTRYVVDPEIRHHRVEGRILVWQRLGVAFVEGDRAVTCPGDRQHCRGEVHAACRRPPPACLRGDEAGRRRCRACERRSLPPPRPARDR